MTNWDSYLEPPDYGEWEEDTVTGTVWCRKETCRDFETEIEYSGYGYCFGGSGGTATAQVTYTCPSCQTGNEFEFDVVADEPDYEPYDPDYEN